MKAYVFVTLNLCAMHGANMYIYNKVQFLNNRGYKTYVFSAEQGDILIKGLQEYKCYQYSILRFYPYCFSDKKIKSFIQKVHEDIKFEECQEIVVESTNLISALWGEIIASNFQCKHLTFILQERFGFSNHEKDFLRFKLKYNELAGISDNSVKHMLDEEYIEFNSSMSITAHCNNTIDNCPDSISPQLTSNAKMTIASIGRLEKPYVKPLLSQLSQILDNNNQYNLVLIGGTRANKRYQEIRDIFKGQKNINLIFTGYMFPIPRSFVEKCDVFISAAGSAAASYYQKKPTIKLNANDGSIFGLLGYSCEIGETALYSSNSCHDISELKDYIQMAIDYKNQINYLDLMIDGSYELKMSNEFQRQLEFVHLSTHTDYYDTRKIKNEKKEYFLFNYLGKILSPDILYNTLDKARHLLK